MCCPLVFELSVGIGGFVIGLGHISFFFSLLVKFVNTKSEMALLTIFVGKRVYAHSIRKNSPHGSSIISIYPEYVSFVRIVFTAIAYG